MRLTNRIGCLVLFCLTLTIQVRSQQAFDHRDVEAIERDTVALLLKEDLPRLIDRLIEERPTTVAPLLRQLILYSRAGRPEGIRQTLEQLGAAADWQSAGKSYHVQAKVKQLLGEDFVAWRTYYERLNPHDFNGAEAFVRLWERQGDVKELDGWLAALSTGFDGWFQLRLYRRAGLGTANELLAPLAVAVRANPRDRKLVQQYLQANNWAGNLQDVSWLADVCETDGAYENYELGQWLGHTSPAAAARLLQKSLTLPFTERDAASTQTAFMRISYRPRRVNPEKQLRYWSRKLLAEAYQALKRPLDAQPLIEELVAMKGDDILDQDVHQLAGGIQGQSGQRVVETGILRDEATQRQTAKYWLERASYYHGRSEETLEKETYFKALAALPGPNDPRAESERLNVVRSLTFFLWENLEQQPQWRSDLEKMLRREFNSARPESSYAFWLARIMTNDDLELDALRHSLYVAQPNLVSRLLGARAKWGSEERYLIEGIIGGDEVTAAEEDAIWTALEKLVTDPGSTRAYELAEAMTNRGASERALPLWVGYLNNASSFEYINRNKILTHVIDGYCLQGKWQTAEQLLFSNASWSWESMPHNLGTIAASAAQHSSLNEAMRLWRLKANLDRRDLTGLDQLARTEAKLQLRGFYLQMKKEEPQTTAPDLALSALQ